MTFEQLLELLGYTPDEHIGLCWMPPKGGMKYAVRASNAASNVTKLPTNCDVWFGVNPTQGPPRTNVGGRGDANAVTRLAALWVDLDVKPGGCPSFEVAEAIIGELSGLIGTRPSAVVMSGHGLQPYWPVEDCEPTAGGVLVRRWGRLVAACAAHHGAAIDNVYDLPRILRVPGTFNNKGEPVPVTATSDTGGPLTVSEIGERLDEAGIYAVDDDTRSLEVLSAPQGWRWAAKTCPYVTTLVDGLSQDAPRPGGGRNPWACHQAVRLHCAIRLGCISKDDFCRAQKSLEARLTHLLTSTEPQRSLRKMEMRDVFNLGRQRAACKTDEQAHAELGEHLHDNDGNGDKPDPAEYIDGANLLDMIHEFLGRFINYPNDYTHVAHTLWIVHTWFMDRWESTPRIAFLSPEPASGKSRALEVTEALVPRPIHSVNVTPAYLFRKVADPAGRPTILYDEIDTVFGPKAKEHEEIRGLLNSGHRKGATAGRCVIKGKKIETEEIPSYCAVALAGLHSLPDTILTRSVVVPMRRRAAGEHIEPWRMSVNGLEAAPLKEALAQWSVAILETEALTILEAKAETTAKVAAVAAGSGKVAAVAAMPILPAGIEDRDADVWEALVGVGDLAGGHWAATSRVAAVAAVAAFRDMEPTLGVQLLWDIHQIFCDSGHGTLPANVAARTADLLSNLKGIEEAPWANYGRDRKGLDTMRLSKFLSNYGIKPRNTKFGTSVAKAYHVWQFEDAWRRYGTGPPTPSMSEKAATPATAATSINDNFWS